MTLEEFKKAANTISNLNGNTISNFLNKHYDIYMFVKDIFNSDPKKYCTLNKTFIALVKDIKFGRCKACNKELTYDQTWSKADYCSNKCKLSVQVNPFTREDVKAKIKKTNLARYDVENPMFSQEIKDKVKATNKERYGCINPFQREDVKAKIRQTNLDRYGVEFPFQNEEIKQKFKDSRKISAYANFQKLCQKYDYTLLCDFEHYKGVDEVYQLQCNKCGNIFNARYDDGKLISRCFVCEPRKYPPIRSKKEIEVCDYVCSIYDGLAIPNDRTVIGPQEIDIYLPDLHLGVEFDGTYWHSLKAPDYHEKKDALGLAAGVKIVHVKEADWDDHKDDVKFYLQSLIFPKYPLY